MFPQNTHFLVVDDHEIARVLVVKVLMDLGFPNITQASNGLKAWEILNPLEGEYPGIDIAILDWHMPDMMGNDLLKRIRGDMHYKNLPVMFITAEAKRNSVQEAADQGVGAYILKPFTPNTFKQGLLTLEKKLSKKVEPKPRR